MDLNSSTPATSAPSHLRDLARPDLRSAQKQLRGINFELAEIYFPVFVLQMRYHVFPLRNRNQRQNYSGHQTADFVQDSSARQALSGYEEVPDDDYELH